MPKRKAEEELQELEKRIGKNANVRQKLEQYMTGEVDDPNSVMLVEAPPPPASTAPFDAFLKEYQKKSAPQFYPHWLQPADDLIKPDCYLFVNKLAGQSMYFKGSLTHAWEGGLPQNAEDQRLWDDIVRIGTTLPFPLVSFFVSERSKHLMVTTKTTSLTENDTYWRLMLYNRDPTKAAEIIKTDEENGKLAFHPYYMFIDKFSAELLKTLGVFGPYFLPRLDVHDDTNMSTFVHKYETLSTFIALDEYNGKCPGVTAEDIACAIDTRRLILEQTPKMLHEQNQREIQLARQQLNFYA